MTTTPPSHRKTWLIAAAVIIVLAAAVFWFTRHHEAKEAAAKKPPMPPVGVTTVLSKTQDVDVFRTGIGSVTPTFSVTVKARVDGELDRVGFTEGQDVKKGQMLAQLDPRPLQAQLMQVQATRAKDEATLVNARVDLQRYTTLVSQDAATTQQLDTQKALVKQLEATVKNDDAQINYAQVQLGFTTINAPISGRVGTRLVDPGNIVHAADTTGLVVINQIDPISVLFTLPEDAVQATIHALDSHKPLVVEAFPRDSTRLLAAGTLTVLNNQIDTSTGTVQLKASFPNSQHNLWPGQYVDVRLVLGTRKNALVVPAAAVQRSQSGVYVYAIDPNDNTARSHSVNVLQNQDGIAVVEGLSAGQRVVVDGQYKLKPGSRVVEVSRAASGAARGASGAGGAASAGSGASSGATDGDKK